MRLSTAPARFPAHDCVASPDGLSERTVAVIRPPSKPRELTGRECEVLSGSDSVKPRCPLPNQALPGGYPLLNYRIDRQISRGGFSIVYRAFDETARRSPIKEYLPSSLVLRTEGDIVRATSAREHDAYPLRR